MAWIPTLDDVLGAPTGDPQALDQHLRQVGAVPAPPPSPPRVGPMSDATAPATIPFATATEHPILKSAEKLAMFPRNSGIPALPSAPEMGPGAAPAAPPAIAPMMKPLPPAAPANATVGALPETAGGSLGGVRVTPMAPPLTNKEGKAAYAAQRPQVTADPGQNPTQYLQQKLTQEVWDRQHQYGAAVSAQPGLLGKIGHIAAKIGNIAGQAIVPNLMNKIPGTEAYKEEQLGGTAEALKTSEAQDIAKQNAEEARLTAEENRRNIESEITARQNPKPKLLPGEENVAIGPDNTRYQRYEMGNGTTQWVREGEVPQAVPATALGAAPRTTPAAAPQAGAAAPAAPGLPTGATVGKPKVLEGEEKYVQEGLKDRGLADTAENRLALSSEYKNGAPVGDAEASQMSKQIGQALKGTGIDAGGYAVTAGSTKAQAAEALKAAQAAATAHRQEASAERVAGAPEKAQERKDERTAGYALDPDGKLVLTNRAQVDKWNAADGGNRVFEEMKPDAVNKDRASLRQLNDIQKNVSAYQKAINTPTGPLEHVKAMQRIEAGINQSDVEKMGYLTMGAAMNMMEQGEVGKAWNELNPEERQIMLGYLRAKGAMIAYNRVVSGSARSNKEALEVEWANLPQPYVGATVANDQMKAMQENLDQVNMGYPTNLPAMKTPEEVREKTEGGGAGGGGEKTATMANVQAYATQHNISDDAAKKFFQDSHYTVK